MIGSIYYVLAKFAYNNSEQYSTGYSPCFANIGYHPRWVMLEHPELLTNPTTEDHLTRLQEIRTIVSHNLCDTQKTQKKVVDCHRRDSLSKFQVGHRIWLLKGNIKTMRPCCKLDYQRFGLYVISGKIMDVAFRLDLPPHMHLHPVFNVSLLDPYTTSSILSPPPPIEVSDGSEYEVVIILYSKIVCNKLYYLVD